MSKPVFIDRETQEKIKIPEAVFFFDKDGKEKILTFDSPKTNGRDPGGWYKDSAGKKYMVKEGSEGSYVEELLNNLARICVAENFVAEETTVGNWKIPETSEEIPCFISSEISDFKTIGEIDEFDERKSHATKFHCAFAFHGLISYDDSNEYNLGIFGQNAEAKIIDYGIFPSFLYPDYLQESFKNSQKKYADIPLHLVSLIGYRSAYGMQAIRRRFFGHEDSLNPFNKNKKTTEAPQDVSFYSVLEGIKKILENEEKIFAEVDKTFSKVEAAKNLIEKQKIFFAERFGKLGAKLKERISWMRENFAADLENLDEKKAEFSQLKWRNYPKFLELMKLEIESSVDLARKEVEKSINEATQNIVAKKTPREKFLQDLPKILLQRNLMQKFKNNVDDNCLLHAAVTANDFEMVKFLLEKIGADINQIHKTRRTSYHQLDCTALQIAIGTYHDRMIYDTTHSSAGKEMIEILAKKFFEKNGESYDENKIYNGDKMMIRMTYASYEDYLEQKSKTENQAASIIQGQFRALKSKNLASKEQEEQKTI